MTYIEPFKKLILDEISELLHLLEVIIEDAISLFLRGSAYQGCFLQQDVYPIHCIIIECATCRMERVDPVIGEVGPVLITCMNEHSVIRMHHFVEVQFEI